MFGILKKKIKESVEKISNVVKSKEEPEIEEIQEKIDKVVESETATEKRSLADIEAEIAALEQKIEKDSETPEPKPVYEEKAISIKEEPEEIPVQEIPKPEPIIQEVPKIQKMPVAEIKKKEGLLQKIKKKIVEKELQESDIKDILWDLQISLVQSDVALEVAEKIVKDLERNLIGRSVERKNIDNIVKESVKNSVSEILDVEAIDIESKISSKKPYVIVFVGFNGSGKTTTIARVGHLLKEKGHSVVFAAADTWRAASIEQIEEHGKNLNIPVIKQKYGADPAAVIFDAVKHAESKGVDVVLADTAGRSHANLNLIEELKKITRVNNPDMKILIMDALTGNDVVEQTSMFNDAVGVDALILTKTDVYEKGGAILSSVFNIKKPILFLGVGQDYKDLKKFDAEEILKNLME